MAVERKPIKALIKKKLAVPLVSRVRVPEKTSSIDNLYEAIGSLKLQKANQLLTRIERKGEALSASADKLLRRVS